MTHTHGHTKGGKTTREYKTWQSMMQRCYKTYAQQFPNYGAKHIQVCPRWHVFENFFLDMGPKPAGLTIERRDNNGNYEPSNCYWATTAEQNRNKGDTQKITFRGKTQSIAEWAREIGVGVITLRARIVRYGMPVEKALMMPLGLNKRLLTLGDKTQSVADWAKEAGIKRPTLSRRLNKQGLTIEQALRF